jgi:hypothetical protein
VRPLRAVPYILQTFPCAISNVEVYVEETNDVAAERKTSLATARNKFKDGSLDVHQFH